VAGAEHHNGNRAGPAAVDRLGAGGTGRVTGNKPPIPAAARAAPRFSGETSLITEQPLAVLDRRNVPQEAALMAEPVITTPGGNVNGASEHRMISTNNMPGSQGDSNGSKLGQEVVSNNHILAQKVGRGAINLEAQVGSTVSSTPLPKNGILTRSGPEAASKTPEVATWTPATARTINEEKFSSMLGGQQD